MARTMKRRARRPAPEAVANFAGKVEKQEIAASRDGSDITRGWLYPLQLAPVDDTVLLQRGGGVVAGGGARKGAADVLGIEQRGHGGWVV